MLLFFCEIYPSLFIVLTCKLVTCPFCGSSSSSRLQRPTALIFSLGKVLCQNLLLDHFWISQLLLIGYSLWRIYWSLQFSNIFEQCLTLSAGCIFVCSVSMFNASVHGAGCISFKKFVFSAHELSFFNSR